MNVQPTETERTFGENVILVTKTDTKGKITYANKAFSQIVQLHESKLVGQPHSIVRHPDMPKIIFKYLWQYLQSGTEIHAYVKNICADGSFYWVMANVTPSYGSGRAANGNLAKNAAEARAQVIGYHSSRRLPTKGALDVIIPLYKQLLDAEKSGGIDASAKLLENILYEKGVEYDEFILSI